MLYQLLKDSSERYPGNIAAVYEYGEYSYRELLQSTDRMANSLLDLGLKRGNRLAFYLFNRPEIIICYFVCFKIGVTLTLRNEAPRGDPGVFYLGGVDGYENPHLFWRTAGIEQKGQLD